MECAGILKPWASFASLWSCSPWVEAAEQWELSEQWVQSEQWGYEY